MLVENKRPVLPRFCNRNGFSYIEVLLGVILIGVLLVPALEGLHGAYTGVTLQDRTNSDYLELRSKMEEVLARPYSMLAAEATPEGAALSPTSYSGLPYTTLDGRQVALIVYISGYDADNADGDSNIRTGTDPGLLRVLVIMDGVSRKLETLVSEV